MHFSAFLFPQAVLASVVLGSPLVKRVTSVTAVGPLAAPPEYKAGEVITRPSPAVDALGAIGSTVVSPGVSKRSDSNELTKRTTPYGTLYLCGAPGCTGFCTAYSLPPSSSTCYATVPFYSAYIDAADSLSYGVFVGFECSSMPFQS